MKDTLLETVIIEGLWSSLVRYVLREHEIAGSNPASPINHSLYNNLKLVLPKIKVYSPGFVIVTALALSIFFPFK